MLKHHQPIVLLLLSLIFGLECAASDQSKNLNDNVNAGVVSSQDDFPPPYDVFRVKPSALHPVFQPNQTLPRDGSINFDKLPRRPDGLPYVVRLMWGTCITPDKSSRSFSCIWSDGTVTHRMVRTELHAEERHGVGSPQCSPQSYELRYIFKPDDQTGGE